MTLAHWILYGSLATLAPWLLLWLVVRPGEDGMDEQTVEHDEALNTSLPEDADVPPEGGMGRDHNDVRYEQVTKAYASDIRILDGEIALLADKMKQLKAQRSNTQQKLNSYILGDCPLFETRPAAEVVANPAEAWKQVPLRDVLAGLPEKKLELLEGADLKSLADFEAFRAKYGEGPWPIKGIGPETRSQIEECVLTWLGKWMAKHAPVEAESDA